MEKTVNDLVNLLQEFVDQKSNYESVIKGLKETGWEKYFLFVKEPKEESRSRFMWVFERENASANEVIVLTHAYRSGFSYCFLILGERTFQIASPGGTSIKDE